MGALQRKHSSRYAWSPPSFLAPLPCASRCVVSLAPSLTDDGILLTEREREDEIFLLDLSALLAPRQSHSPL